MSLEKSAEILLEDEPTARKSLSLAYIAEELGSNHELYDEIESYIGDYLEPEKSMSDELRSSITENLDDTEIGDARENLREFLGRVKEADAKLAEENEDEVQQRLLVDTGRKWLYFRADSLKHSGDYLDVLQNRIES